MEDNSAITPDVPRELQTEAPTQNRRRRARELLLAQRQQLNRLENDLADQLQSLAAQLARESAAGVRSLSQSTGNAEECDQFRLQLQQVNAQLAARQASLVDCQSQLANARLESNRLEQELRIRDALLQDAQTQLEKRRLDWAALQEQLADSQAQAAAVRARLDDARQQLDALREGSQEVHQRTEDQRRKIAHELKARRAELHAEFDRRHAELQTLRESLAQQQQTCRQQAEHTAAVDTAATADAHLIEQLKAERDALAEKLAAAEARPAARAEEDEAESRKRADLQRRFEMAVEDLREMKRANAELENKLAKARSSAGATVDGGGLDWESQKRRLLASLEADDRNDDDAIAERSTIEGTIQITDQIIAQKDQEIAELKRMLQDQSNSAGSLAVGAAAVADLLDQDELVRLEREKLQQAQAEWREKIGKAEIDISVERAKIARDRAELEEKIRSYQLDQEDRTKDSDLPAGGKTPRGRWLTRLGLKEIDEST